MGSLRYIWIRELEWCPQGSLSLSAFHFCFPLCWLRQISYQVATDNLAHDSRIKIACARKKSYSWLWLAWCGMWLSFNQALLPRSRWWKRWESRIQSCTKWANFRKFVDRNQVTGALFSWFFWSYALASIQGHPLLFLIAFLKHFCQ
jgi:hypothetical protein